MAGSYSPSKGDLVWVNLVPRTGHERSAGRPGIVLSSSAYNATVGLMLCCPITSREKGYRFEVRLPDGLPISGVILADQVRSFDWKARNVTLIAKAPDHTTEDVLAKLRVLLS